MTEAETIKKIVLRTEQFLAKLRAVQYAIDRRSSNEFGGKKIVSLKKLAELTGYPEKEIRLDITTQGFKPVDSNDNFYLDDVLTFITSRLAFCFKVMI